MHLLTLLQAKGVTLAAAVSLGALVGPAQVGARAVELAVARNRHPALTNVVATALVSAGIGALWWGSPILLPALLLYGAGIGLESIVRGTLPLAVYGPARYPVLMGKIAMPNLLAQAVAPWVAPSCWTGPAWLGAWRRSRGWPSST